MKILMTASEMAPFARTGALADSVQALSLALVDKGHEVTVVLPFYRCVEDAKEFSIRATKIKFSVPVGEARYDCEVFESRSKNGLRVLFVGREEFFDRSGLYGAHDRDYQDNAARFIFFNKCVVELARRLDPDVIHAHDWQTALLPVLARAQALPKPVVLTVHDAAYQGNFWSYDFGLTNLPADYFSTRGLEFYGSMNFLKGGILLADRVTLPSERFVAEAQTAKVGSGLEAVFREQARKLAGIPDGVPAEQWNPATDASLAAPFSANDLSGKTTCREKLLAELNLAPNPAGPVVSWIAAFGQEQGMKEFLPIVDRLLAADVRLILAGKPAPELDTSLRLAVKRHADQFAWLPEADGATVHRILAGTDATLIPGPLEPLGYPWIHALKLGTLPIALSCGGLRQAIADWDPATEWGNGFVYFEDDSEALLDALRRAATVFANRPAWSKIVNRAMTTDYSWSATADRVEGLYGQLLGRPVSLAA